MSNVTRDALDLRNELASLRNQGGYQEQQFYFDSLVTNGTFDADTDWTKHAGATISSGTLNFESATGAVPSGIQEVPFVAGKTYRFLFDVINPNSVSWAVGFNKSTTSTFIDTSDWEGYQTGAGSFSYDLTASPLSVGIVAFQQLQTAVGLKFDNVSVFETDGTDVVHRMPKGWVPKDVYEDGLLQREGAANDYEVVYDGFDYFVKPVVAPSATTQTCVIGVRK